MQNHKELISEQTFITSRRVMQNLVMGVIIGIDFTFDELYHLSIKVATMLISIIREKKNKKINIQSIIQWHKGLGHVPFFCFYASVSENIQ